MTEIVSLHRLAYRLEERYGVGNDNITVDNIHVVAKNEPSIPDFNSGVWRGSLIEEGMLAHTSGGSCQRYDPAKYSVLPGWDAGVSKEQVKKSVMENTPDSEAETTEFAEF